jgi:hypothetical protein
MFVGFMVMIATRNGSPEKDAKPQGLACCFPSPE